MAIDAGLAAHQQILLAEIDEKIGEVRTDALDLSFGELINLKSTGELIIDPEYQRLFRWSLQQKSRLVESVLLKLPIPPIFLMENTDGTLELIDGLQRVSSMIQLIDPELIAADNLTMDGCDLISALDGMTYMDLPLALRLQLKRASVRAIVIKRQSASFLRYEMFKRLNTGGSLLSSQELRNCSARLFGRFGVDFYSFVVALSTVRPFASTTASLSDADEEKRGREELALRFLAAKNRPDLYQGNVTDWLDNYMEAVLTGRTEIEFDAEMPRFIEVFDVIDRAFGETAFVKFKNDRPIGGLAPGYFEAISIAIHNAFERAASMNPRDLAERVNAARQSPNFRENVGAGANNRRKFYGRVAVIQDAIEAA